MPIFRLRWSEFERYHPLRIIIKDWKNLKIANYGRGRYLLIPSAMEYKNRKIELCVPYDMFVRRLRLLPLQQQKLIVNGKAVLELMKTWKKDNFGMRIMKIEHVNSGDTEPPKAGSKR